MTKRQVGLTLIELVISIVIISIALTAILAVMNRTTSSSGDPMLRAQAISIAESYLEEILLQSYLDPDGTEVGETRSTFDDVDDYHNLVNNGCNVASTFVCDQNGNPNTSLENYSVNVTVTNDGASLNGLANNRALRVDVNVSDTITGVSVQISGYRACYPATTDPLTNGCP